MARSVTQYFRLLRSLFPKGKLWNNDDNSVLSQFLKGTAVEFTRIELRMEDLINESLFSRIDETIENYEIEYSLPEPGDELGATLEERKDDVYAKFFQIGQQFAKYYIDYAETLNYDIIIETYKKFIAGISACGDSIIDSDVVHYWTIKAQIDGTFGAFGAGFWANEIDSSNKNDINYVQSQTRNLDKLISKLTPIKPAHTLLLFDFVGAGFGRGFAFDFKSIPTSDATIPIEEYQPEFSSAFTSVGNYNGSYLKGSFSRGFGLSMNAAKGGSLEKTAFGNAFEKSI